MTWSTQRMSLSAAESRWRPHAVAASAWTPVRASSARSHLRLVDRAIRESVSSGSAFSRSPACSVLPRKACVGGRTTGVIDLVTAATNTRCRLSGAIPRAEGVVARSPTAARCCDELDRRILSVDSGRTSSFRCQNGLRPISTFELPSPVLSPGGCGKISPSQTPLAPPPVAADPRRSAVTGLAAAARW